MKAMEVGPAVMLDELAGYAEEFERGRQGWKAVRVPGGVRFIRDGYVRVSVLWVGHERWVLTWEYGMGTGKLVEDWRVEVYPTDEIGLQTHMTLNAMWR